MKKGLILILYSLPYTITFAQAEKIKLFSYQIENTSELQYNLTDSRQKDPKYVNLATFYSSLSTRKWWKNGLFEVSFLSAVQSFNRNIAGDELTFSNVEADNYKLKCAVLGYRHQIGHVEIFGGIRSVDEDYFTSPYSTLFTNSSAGLYPTISMNMGIATYPISSLGIHAEYNNQEKGINIKNSFYNNINDINDKTILNLKFDPKRYGYVNISQFEYTTSRGVYDIGTVFEKRPDQRIRKSFYALAEQTLIKTRKQDLGVIAQFGYAPKEDSYCSLYYGAGIIYSDFFLFGEEDDLGLIASFANLESRNETTIELTYKSTFHSFFTIQPSLHYIHYDGSGRLAGLIRAIITIGN